MKKSKYINFDKLNDTMDTTIRDAEIRAYWDGLKHSKMNYDKKIELIKNKYHISYESVTRIIYNK
jgi:hypothetical protein